MIDRGRDAADIFTATGGVGAGAKARLGPLQAGLLVQQDKWGLRGGRVGSFKCVTHEPSAPVRNDSMDFVLLLVSLENFELDQLHRHETTTEARRKEFSAVGVCPISIAGMQPDLGFNPYQPCPYYYTQMELVIGCGPSLRLGVNPGELLDFILGWMTIDMFNDDLERRKQNEESNKPNPGDS